MNKKIYIILIAAVLYGISIPISKIILQNDVQPVMLAAFTYLGAGIGLGLYNLFNKFALGKNINEPLTKKELPYTLAMVILDITAIILLMNGISLTNSANASLLSNCEIASTSIIALIFFKEYISKKLWTAIILIISAGMILTFEGEGSLDFSLGSILVIASYVCWGAENNCTKMISSKNTQEITIIKGLFSGIGSLIIALMFGEHFPSFIWLFIIILMGFLSYGLSVAMYIKSQNHLGAAKTAAYFSTAPFFGVIFSLLILGEKPGINFYISLIIMLIAGIFISKDYNKN